MEYVLLIGGLITLIVAGEALVRGAVGVALKFKIPTLVIGMTIVSFGTSAPELLVSLKAALEGHPELSIGNVVGSNVANLALVLGLTAIVLPIAVKRTTVKIDWVIMMVFTVLFYLFIIDELIQWYEGLIFVLALVGFNIFMFRGVSKSDEEEEDIDIDIEDAKKKNILLQFLLILIGCIGLAYGADWLLDGAVTIATNFGVSEHTIAVTIVAFGTSVPELITSVVAALKKETDISLGNLIGSNIFNILGVLGITALVKEVPVSSQVISNDIFWVLGISLLVFPLMIINYRINRFRGLLLFLSYVVYIYFVVS